MTTEHRTIREAVTFRAAQDGGPGGLGGYALKFNRLSQNLGGFVERVRPGFVDKSLADNLDVLCRFQHEDQFILGRVGSGTLHLTRDDVGLVYDVPQLPDTSAGRDVAELAKRGDLGGSSFAFITLDEEWTTTEQGFPLRDLIAGRLIDVAPVVSPAYLDTSVAARSLAERIHADPNDIPALVERGEIAERLKRPTVIDLGQQPDGQRDTHPADLTAHRRQLLAKQLAGVRVTP